MAVTKLIRTTFDELLKMFDPRVHDAMKANFGRMDVEGIVVFECLDVDSPHFGKRTALIYGPGCTYKTLMPLAEGCLRNIPETSLYPTFYAEKRGI